MWLTHAELMRWQHAWNKTFPEQNIYIATNKDKSTIVAAKYDVHHYNGEDLDNTLAFTGKISCCISYMKGMLAQKTPEQRTCFYLAKTEQ